MFKKFMAVVIMLAVILPSGVGMSGFAEEELPHAFWALNDAYMAAKDAGDDAGIIAAGEQVIDLLTAQTETTQIKEILSSRYYDVADAYDRGGNFAKAAEYYERYIPYGEYMNWTDGVRIARMKVAQYRPSVSMYTDAVQSQRYFGSRNEREFGVLYGEVAEETKTNESMILLYIDYGNMPSDWERSILDKAKERGTAVEIAWNIQGEGAALADIPNQGEYVNAFLDVLNQYSTVPIYLRIGAEMNVWPVKADPQQFRTAFSFIADLVHARTSHVATVWSVAHASDWETKMEDFYPGDEYVDWVGISAYMIRHFQGQEWPAEQRFTEVSFGTGAAADPVLLVKETVEKFGNRKPIMLAECGSAHTTTSLGTDNTDWAVTNLQRMYWFVPMVYPQVKLIAYFNTYISPETNDFALVHNSALEQTYQGLVQAPHFIQSQYSGNAAHTYRPVTWDMVLPQKNTAFYSYPHVFGDDKPQVRYYVDGNLVGERTEIPYRLDLDLSGYSLGAHTIRSEAVSGGAVMAVQECTIQVAEMIHVQVDGTEIAADVPPVMESDRVLVPMRSIFEALGASVTWEESTGTAVARKGQIEVELSIDQKVMKKNGNSIELDVPARMINDRTMVPVRAVSEALEAAVTWVDESATVQIQQP